MGEVEGCQGFSRRLSFKLMRANLKWISYQTQRQDFPIFNFSVFLKLPHSRLLYRNHLRFLK